MFNLSMGLLGMVLSIYEFLFFMVDNDDCN
mgnify:CR=1 FL=1